MAKTIVFLVAARKALQTHRNMAQRTRDKLAAYAEHPASLANQVTEMRGEPIKRLRVGSFRVLFEENETEIIVSDIGPRGLIYKGE
jgi:mRNA-degrading endonuclease RelE of RelBE toxin-antitoxin system